MLSHRIFNYVKKNNLNFNFQYLLKYINNIRITGDSDVPTPAAGGAQVGAGAAERPHSAGARRTHARRAAPPRQAAPRRHRSALA